MKTCQAARLEELVKTAESNANNTLHMRTHNSRIKQIDSFDQTIVLITDSTDSARNFDYKIHITGIQMISTI